MDTFSDESLELLYRKAFPVVAQTVANLGGDLNDARDVFHDALIIYLEKQATLRLRSTPTAYLTGIAKILWVRKFNRQLLHTSITESEDALAVPEDFYTIEKETPPSLVTYLQAAGKKCMELLQAFYYEQQSLQQITQRFNFKTKRSAAVQKHKCLEKVRDHLKTTIYAKATA